MLLNGQNVPQFHLFRCLSAPTQFSQDIVLSSQEYSMFRHIQTLANHAIIIKFDVRLAKFANFLGGLGSQRSAHVGQLHWPSSGQLLILQT